MKFRIFYIVLGICVFSFIGFTQPVPMDFRNASMFAKPEKTGLKRSTNLVHTKSINYTWNNSAWEYFSNANYKYNSDGKQIELKMVDTVNSMNLFIEINYYDSRKNSTGYIYLYWDSVYKRWDTVQGVKYIYQYNASDYITQKVTQEWDNGWGNLLKEDFVLEANGKYNMVTVYQWFGNNWAPYYKDTLCKWQGDQLASFIELVPNGNGWRNDARYGSVFSGQKDFIAVYEIFNGAGWDSLYRFTQKYNSYGGYSRIIEQYNINTWVKAGRYQYFVDSLGNYYGFQGDEWDYVKQTWSQYDGEQILFTYNSSELVLQEVLTKYSTFTHKMENKEKHVFTEFSAPPTVSVNPMRLTTEYKLYPNPVHNNLTIEALNQENANVNLKISDLNGREVFSGTYGPASFPLRLDTGKFSTGLYLVELTDHTGTSRVKLLIR